MSETFLRGELNICAVERDQGTYESRIYNCTAQRRMSLSRSQDTHSQASREPPLRRGGPTLKGILEGIINFISGEQVLTTVQRSQQRLATRDDSILIPLSPILTLVYHSPYCRACVNVSLAENDEKTDKIRNIRGKFQQYGN